MKKYTSFLFILAFALGSFGFTNINLVHAENLPAGCASTAGYSPLTGVKCDSLVNTSLPLGCTSTVGYSPITGVKCDSLVNTSLPPGCTSTVGYSSLTGVKCDSNTSFPPGCTSTLGYSTTTGLRCDGGTQATVYLSSNGYTTDYTAGYFSAAFSVTSNTDWTVSSDQGWLTLNKTNGSGNSTVGFSFTANTATTTTTSRTAIITVRAGNQTATYTFTQNGTTNLHTPTISSILPAGCDSSTGYNSSFSDACNGARIGYTVYVWGANFNSNADLATYSTIDGSRVFIPATFINSGELLFVVPQNAGTGLHSIQVNTGADQNPILSNSVNLNFTNTNSNTSVGELRGKVCLDMNNNGTCDSGEMYAKDSSSTASSCTSSSVTLSGVTVSYTGPVSGTAVVNKCSTTTGDPIFSVTGLPVGTYTVRVNLPSGYTHATSQVGQLNGTYINGSNPATATVTANNSEVVLFGIN
jgi:hypothetical protein